MKSVDLTLIFLTYNTPEWISLALSSLKQHYLDSTKLFVEVIVVDNASTDHTVQQVHTRFPWVKVIEAKANAGFAAGNNLALKKVKSRYVMLLNSDVELLPNSTFDELVQYMDAHPEISVITPRVELASGKLDPASHRGEPTVWASLTYFSGLARRFPHSKFFAQYHQTYHDMNTIHRIDACSGAAMLVRTSAMKQVGLLDEQFFMYAEDLDWCRRFREAGGGIVYYPTVVVRHHKYKSGQGSAEKKVAKSTSIHFYQTMLQYFDKHYRRTSLPFVRLGIRCFIWYNTRTKK